MRELILVSLLIIAGQQVQAALTPHALQHALRSPKNRPQSVLASAGYTPSSDLGTQATFRVDASYTSTIDENYSLVWAPLPTGILYRFRQTEESQAAVQWSLGLTSLGRTAIAPRFDSFFRKQLQAGTQLEVQVEYGTEIYLDAVPSIWSLEIAIGGRQSLAKSVAAVAGFQVVTQDALMRKLFVTDAKATVKESSFALTAPLYAGFDFERESEGHHGIEYVFRGLGLNSELSVHTVEVYYSWVW